jgi:hypothetical protein
MVMHPNKGVDTDDQSEEGKDEEDGISIEKCISLAEKLTKELEERSFIFEQHIMWIYNI